MKACRGWITTALSTRPSDWSRRVQRLQTLLSWRRTLQHTASESLRDLDRPDHLSNTRKSGFVSFCFVPFPGSISAFITCQKWEGVTHTYYSDMYMILIGVASHAPQSRSCNTHTHTLSLSLSLSLFSLSLSLTHGTQKSSTHSNFNVCAHSRKWWRWWVI